METYSNIEVKVGEILDVTSQVTSQGYSTTREGNGWTETVKMVSRLVSCVPKGNDQIHTTSRARPMSIQRNLLDITVKSFIF